MSCFPIMSWQPVCNISTVCCPRCPPVLSLKLNSFSSSDLGKKYPKFSINVMTASKSRHQCLPVCLFGGKQKAENEDEGSPWKALEKVMRSFKKEQSVEDTLKQQMERKEFYDDGGRGGGRPRGGGGGGGPGEPEDPNLSSSWDERLQVALATLSLITLYFYIIKGEYIFKLARDLLLYLFQGRQSRRLKVLSKAWREFSEPEADVTKMGWRWVRRALINTTTKYDSPDKYRHAMKNYLLAKIEDKHGSKYFHDYDDYDDF